MQSGRKSSYESISTGEPWTQQSSIQILERHQLSKTRKNAPKGTRFASSGVLSVSELGSANKSLNTSQEDRSKAFSKNRVLAQQALQEVTFELSGSLE